MATDASGLMKSLLLLMTILLGSSFHLRTAYAIDPMAKYKLAMYESPAFPVPDEQFFFRDGLVPMWMKALDRPDVQLQRLVIDTLAIAHRRGMKGLEQTHLRVVELMVIPNQDLEIIRSAAAALVTFNAQDQTASLIKVSAEQGQPVAVIVEPALANWKTASMETTWLNRVEESGESDTMTILAINGLESLRSAKGIESLSKIVSDSHRTASVRLSAARALGTINGDGLAALATALVDQPGHPIELSCAIVLELLNQRRDPEAVALLARLLDQESTTIQSGALQRMFAIDSDLVDVRVEKYRSSKDVNVRRWCARAMLAKKAATRVAVLSEMLDDVNPGLRDLVADGLIELAEDSNLRDEVIVRTSEVINKNNWRGCEKATFVLAKLDHKPAGNRMVELLGHERPEVKVATAWALTQLRIKELLPAMLTHAQSVYDGFQSGKLNDTMPGFSLQVAHLFIAFGDQRYLESEPLLTAYIPKSTALGHYSRPAAAWALGMLHEDDAKSELIRILDERLLDVGGLFPENEDVRRMSAISLGRMKAETALADLRKFGEGPAVVARACQWSLQRLTGKEPPSVPTTVTEIEGWFLQPIHQAGP